MGLHTINELVFTQHINMPDKGKIIIADWGVQPSWSKETPSHFWNHSIFRLDKDGNVLWQIKRDEGERTKWAQMREKAEAENSDDLRTRSPFMTLILRSPDGSVNTDPMTGSGPPSAQWTEGKTVICRTLNSMIYELDVNTGVAVNKTRLDIREW